MSYQAVVNGWHDFYIVAGTASATLVGLLFLGLSLHLRTVVAKPDVRSLARVTLANFGLLLFVALFMVIPESQSALASQLIGSGVISIVTVVPSLIAAGRDRGRTLRLHRLVLRFGFSIVSYLAVTVSGVLLFSSFQSSFTWLAVATIVLLIVSLRNTWDLLVTVGDVTPGGEGERIETG